MWAQVINAILGIWLMASPAVLGTDKITANNDHIVGPLVASFAIIALAEATRVTRLYNVPLGLWLLIAPWVLGYDNTQAIMNDMAVGLVVCALSFVKGNVKEKFGGGWSSLLHKDSLHAREARRNP